MYREFFDSAEWLKPIKDHKVEDRTFGKTHTTYEQKLDEIKSWSAAGQKAPVCAKKRKHDPNLD